MSRRLSTGGSLSRRTVASFNSGSMRTRGIRGSRATLTTAIAGTNNDLTYTARDVGTGGNSITVRYLVAGNNTALSVSVSGSAITVNSATSGVGAATSTAQQVLNALKGSNAAMALVRVDHASGNNGTGVIAALAATPLAGGVNRSL